MTSLAAGKPAPLGASYDGKGVNFARQATPAATADRKEDINSVNINTPLPLPDWV